MSSDERKLFQYLAAAHHHIRGMIVDEENGIVEYQDIVSLLELTGSRMALAEIRMIVSQEREHAQTLKRLAERLRIVINKMEGRKP